VLLIFHLVAVYGDIMLKMEYFEITEREYKRLLDDGINFEDKNGNKYIIINGIVLLAITSNEDLKEEINLYGEQEKEIL